MLDLARATAGDKMSLLHHLQTKTAAGGTYLMYSLTVTSVIIAELVVLTVPLACI